MNKAAKRSNKGCGRGPNLGTDLMCTRITTKSMLSRAGAELTEVGTNQKKSSFVGCGKDYYSLVTL